MLRVSHSLSVCVRYPPFHAESDADIFRLILDGFDPTTKKGYKAHFPADIPVSDCAKDLMSKLLTGDTAKRLTAAEVLEHPWLNGGAPTHPMVRKVLDNLKVSLLSHVSALHCPSL